MVSLGSYKIFKDPLIMGHSFIQDYMVAINQIDNRGCTDVIDEHNTITLFFDRRINRFIDEYGNVVHDIYRIITPNQLLMFKEGLLYMCHDITCSYIVELIDTDEDDMEDREQNRYGGYWISEE